MSDPVSRLNAALEGRYRIVRGLGEGGMATVYLADDLRHERKVALKVLKPELAAVVGAERFLAEIKTTAKLQHPHILPLHDSGEAEGFLFYVMPYVEGESLRDRLDRERQLPVDEAVGIALKVAGALHAAHLHGVIHRDIKPANILVGSGEPLIADFGIALAVGAAGRGRLTETGLSLGTPHYMSPEQATGDQVVGPAADVYALGCVIYEALVGDPPHTGSTAQAVLGHIITATPDRVKDHRKSVPAHVDAAIAKALETVPADRFTSADAFAEALADPSFRFDTSAAHGTATGARSWKALALGASSLALGLVGLLSWSVTRPDTSLVARFNINLPDSVPMAYIGSASLGNGRRALALSRDGQRLVYVGEQNGVDRLYVRPLDSYDVRVLPGTEGAYSPFFNPDGRWVGFFVGNEVMKVSLDGQGPVPLATIINPMGGDWGLDDQIVVGNEADELFQLSAEGGGATLLRAERSRAYLYPQILPGNGAVLTSNYGAGFAVSLRGTDEDRVVRNEGAGGRYLVSGHLVWAQLSTLFAARFDADAWEITGQAVPILSGVRAEVYGVSQWDASDTGMLVYAPGSAVSTHALTWIRPDGDEPLPFEGEPHGTFELSPDEYRLAIEVWDPEPSVWIYDLRTGGRERVIHDGPIGRPVWSPDGNRLGFSQPTGESSRAFVTEVDAGTAASPLSPELEGTISSWALAGRLVALDGAPGVTVFDLDDSVRTEIAPPPAWGGVLSPDGRSIAYTMGESGEYQIFVEPFPPTGDRIQVSTQGGSEEPRWSRDAARLYYRNDQRIMVSTITLEPELSREAPVAAFEGDFVNVGGRSYDVATDGSFLIIDGGSGVTTTLNVIPDFFDFLKERVGR